MISKNRELNKMEELEIFNSRYFLVAKKLLFLTGLWPYKHGLECFLKTTFIFLSCTVALISQMTVIFKSYYDYNRAVLLRGLATLPYFLGMLLKLFNQLVMNERIKLSYRSIDENWKMIEDNDELKKLRLISEFGRKIMFFYLIYMYYGAFIVVTLPAIIPKFLDYLFPLSNGTRDKLYILDGEYPFEKTEHYPLIYTIESVMCLVTLFLFTGVDSAYVGCVQHGIAMIGVLKLRLRTATEMKYRIKSDFDFNNVYGKMINVVTLHQRILQYFNIIDHSYSLGYLLTEINSILWISLGTNCVFAQEDPGEIVRFSFIEIGAILQIFYIALQGQMVINASESFLKEMCEIQWFEYPLRVQKLAMFMMLKAQTPIELTAGGLHPMNFEYFGLLVRSTASYITVIASLGVYEEEVDIKFCVENLKCAVRS